MSGAEECGIGQGGRGDSKLCIILRSFLTLSPLHVPRLPALIHSHHLAWVLLCSPCTRLSPSPAPPPPPIPLPSRPLPPPVRYRWVLLLGGINDIGSGSSDSEAVSKGLVHMYAAIRRHGARLAALTCLENRCGQGSVGRDWSGVQGAWGWRRSPAWRTGAGREVWGGAGVLFMRRGLARLVVSLT